MSSPFDEVVQTNIRPKVVDNGPWRLSDTWLWATFWKSSMSREMKPLVPPTSLYTERLILSAAARVDADDIFKNYTGDPIASHYLQRPTHWDLSQTENVLAMWGLENWSSGSQFAWSIRKKNQEDAIGLFLLLLDKTSAEIHFGIARKLWGNGLVTEAGQAVMGWIASTQQIEQVSTVCDCEHTASWRVLEKIGFRRIRHLPQHLFLPSMSMHRDCWLYTWVRSKRENT